MATESFDTVIVGTGFAATFFLNEHLKHAPLDSRILVLEKGKDYPYSWKLQKRANTDYNFEQSFVNKTPSKTWIQNIAFGGGSCWTGNTPRPHESDFELFSRYGISEDWPITYRELEPYLTEAEYLMGISGGEDGPFSRSKPYPQKAHRLNAFDRLIAEKFPGQHLPMPTARSSQNSYGRPSCCGNGVCSTCPITSKFQIDLHMRTVYEDPRVTLRLESDVQSLDIQNNIVKGVNYKTGQELNFVSCDLAVVAAHGIASPFILLKSGLTDPALGRYLNEQFSISVKVDLDGVDNYDGSQAVTGLGVMYHDGDFRKDRPGCYIESWNIPWLRAERNRWRQRALLKFVFEDIPDEQNYVGISKEYPDKPETYHPDHSDYMKAGIAALPELVENLFQGLPVEDFGILEEENLGGDAHIQGTTRMGNNPDTSVVDKYLVHHKVRNLLALGSGAFTSCPAANPTLILSSLAIWAAAHLH